MRAQNDSHILRGLYQSYSVSGKSEVEYFKIVKILKSIEYGLLFTNRNITGGHRLVEVDANIRFQEHRLRLDFISHIHRNQMITFETEDSRMELPMQWMENFR